jgi:hypothetical protein
MNRNITQIAPTPEQNIAQETKSHPPSNETQERPRQFRALRKKGIRLIRAFFKFLPMSRAV